MKGVNTIMNNLKIGSFLQALRKAKGLTQADLAEYFEISSKTVSKWECGDSLPEIPMLKALAEFYDVRVDEILNGERGEVTEKVKNKNDNEQYFYQKKMHKLNFTEILGLSILILGYLFIFVLGYTTHRSDIGCWVSLCLVTISGIVYAFGLFFTGNLELEAEKSKRFNRKRLWYIYGFVCALFFVIIIAIMFYAIPNNKDIIIKFSYFALYNFDVLLTLGAVAGILPLLYASYKIYNKNVKKIIYILVSYILMLFVPISMLYAYSFNGEEVLFEISIISGVKYFLYYIQLPEVFWTYWVGFGISMIGFASFIYSVIKNKAFLLNFFLQLIAYILIYIAILNLLLNQSPGMSALSTYIIIAGIFLVLLSIFEIVLIFRHKKKTF